MKSLKILILVVILLVIATYTTYYYIFQNLEWKLSGFGIAPKSPNDLGLTAIDRLKLAVEIQNNSAVPLSVSNFKIAIFDSKNKQVGNVKTIRKIKVPRNGIATINVDLENINELAILSDTLSGTVKDYEFKVSGLLVGILPISYKAKIV